MKCRIYIYNSLNYHEIMKLMVIYHVHIVFPHCFSTLTMSPFFHAVSSRTPLTPSGWVKWKWQVLCEASDGAAWVINALFLAKSGRSNLLPIFSLPPLFGGYWWNAMEFGKPTNLPFGDGFIPTIYHPFMVISGMNCFWVYHIIWFKY